MGFIPPPEKLSSEEFDKRVNAGARTIAEIDPQFTSWVLSGPWGWFQKIFKTEIYRKLHEPTILNKNGRL